MKYFALGWIVFGVALLFVAAGMSNRAKFDDGSFLIAFASGIGAVVFITSGVTGLTILAFLQL